MNSKPKLSIVVPAYNAEKYLSRCIDSILTQTFRDFELILVDDGSTDRTGELCDEYALQDKRITVFHTENRGQQAAQTKGIEYAGGEYLSVLDADDSVEARMYEFLLSQIGENDIITSAAIRHFPDGREKEIWTDLFEPGVYDLQNNEYFWDNFLIHEKTNGTIRLGGLLNGKWCKLFRTPLCKKIMNKANVGIQVEEDLLFCALAVLSAKSIRVTHEPLYHYYDNENSVVNSRNSHHLIDQNVFWLTLLQEIEGHPYQESIRDQLERRTMYRVFYGFDRAMRFDLQNCLPRFQYPRMDELSGKKIILYGSGIVGKNYRKTFTECQDIKVLMWIDSAAKGDETFLGQKIRPVEDILDLKEEYDFILCAIQDRDYACEMKERLLALGIDQDKILWELPVNRFCEYFLKKHFDFLGV